jgi:hypothetical protein
MTHEEKAADLLKKFETPEIASMVIDEIITSEIQYVSFISKKLEMEYEYDSTYWQKVKQLLNQ